MAAEPQQGKQRWDVLVNMERCKGCDFCVKACPFHLLALGKEINSKAYLFIVFKDSEDIRRVCNACNACTLMCPEAALEILPKQLEQEPCTEINGGDAHE